MLASKSSAYCKSTKVNQNSNAFSDTITEFQLFEKENIRSSEFKMEIRKEVQNNPVADETSALFSVVRPILLGILYSLNGAAIDDCGGIENVKLRQLARNYRAGDGDIGICFEYAIHNAILNAEPVILDRIETALNKFCHIKGNNPKSILFGIEKEKEGSLQLIKTAKENLTTDSILLSGSKGRPVKLINHIDSVASAFRKKSERENLPTSINGLWKADLFVGKSEPDQWVGTTVKINQKDLEGARGLRLAIIPSKQGKRDSIQKDEKKNLIVVPTPYDNSFMEIFFQGWGIVKQFIAADATLPNEVNLFSPADRYVAKQLEGRREFSVLDVVDALKPISQPELLETDIESASIDLRHGEKPITDMIVSPIPKIFGS
jgi:hypothetical protein